VEVRKDTLARAETLVKWSERRVRLDLVDDSEVLQARAARQVRAIELERALEAEKKARVVFNRNRGVEGKEVPELLEGLDAQSAALTFVWQEDAPTSWDVRAARHKIEAEKATWRDAKSNVCPDLNLFASYNSNGLEDVSAPRTVRASRESPRHQGRRLHRHPLGCLHREKGRRRL
jgi:outer membrane protein TolC